MLDKNNQYNLGRYSFMPLHIYTLKKSVSTCLIEIDLYQNYSFLITILAAIQV